MQLKNYPKYKDSGIQWIGRIPEEWEVRKVKNFSFSVAGGTPDTNNFSYWDGEIPWLPSGMIHDNSIHEKDVETFITVEGLNNSSAKWIKNDSVLVALTGATCANIAYLTFKATANQSVIGIECDNKTFPKYIFYYLLSQREQILLNQTGGAQAGINKEDVKNLICAYPDKKDQTTIAAFLDKKTAKIDTLIEKDKKLIALLKEKRTALINHAVTKGLDPNVKLKDSEVEWIDKIPQHWLKLKGKHIGKIFNSISVDLEANSDENEQILFLQVDDLNEYIKDNIIFDSKIKFAKNHNKVYSKKMLIFPKRGAAIFTNKVNIVEKPFMCDSNLMAFQIMMGVTEYYRYQIYARRLDDIADVSTIPQINNKHIYPLAFISPPITEQKKIVEYLDKATSQIDGVIKKIQEKIILMEEYKKSLIHHVVTGKVDVRGVEA